ncbi:MAG: SOS response-associated peptidase [Desulfuromonadales bacterium]
MTMCGRLAQITPSGVLVNLFAVTDSMSLQPRYNIAPTQDVAVVRASGHQRHLALLHWGLVPRWAKDISIGYKTFNARSETVHEKPSFKAAFNLRRCLIPASGFYEWDKLGGSRQPYYISRSDGRPLALAGLWEAWADRQSGEVLESCTILTTSANQTVGRIHDRMPVILEQDDWGLWLDHKGQRTEDLTCLFRPLAEDILEMSPVSTYVNKVGHEGPACIAPSGGAIRNF